MHEYEPLKTFNSPFATSTNKRRRIKIVLKKTCQEIATKVKITSIRLKLDKRHREKDICLGCRSRPDGILGCEGLKFKLSWEGDHICQFVAIHAAINVLQLHAPAIRLRQKQIAATNKTTEQLHDLLNSCFSEDCTGDFMWNATVFPNTKFN